MRGVFSVSGSQPAVLNPKQSPGVDAVIRSKSHKSHVGTSGHDAFVKRLEECVEIAGSIAALAKSAGMVPNTIRRYLNKSEPTRPMLLALAEAASVSPEWLSFGREPKRLDDANIGEVFDSNFRTLVTRYGGAKEFAAANGIEPSVIESILAGGLQVKHLGLLASQWSVPIRWLISDEQGYHGASAHAHLMTLRRFLNRLDEIDDRRLFTGELKTILGQNVDPSWREPVLELLAKIYERIPPGNYALHELKGGVGEFAGPGDLAAVDSSVKVAETGFYAFAERATGFVFVRRVSRTAGLLRDVSGGEAREPSLIAEELYTCMGRVVLLLRLFTK